MPILSKTLYRFLGLHIALLAVLTLNACQQDQNPPNLDFDPKLLYQKDFEAFGTLVSVVIYGMAPAQAELISLKIVADLQHLHHAWHPWKPGPLNRVNTLLKTGGKFAFPPSIYPLYEISLPLYQKSEGFFNPAIGELIQLWGFSNEPFPGKPPSPEQIQALVAQQPRLSDVQVEGLYFKTANPGVTLDFGAVAPGLAADMMIKRMQDMGVNNAIVNTGGEVHVIGKKGQRPWRVGIKNPSGKGMLGFVDMEGDESIDTSGDYERFYIYEGRRYHHIIDPRTGYPTQGTRAVTVIHPQGSVADAAATALMVAGPKDWERIAKSMDIQHAMLITEDNTIYMTKAMALRLKLDENITWPRHISTH